MTSILFAILLACVQDDAILAVEIVPKTDAAGNAWLPHGEPFDVRILNRTEQPVQVWGDRCQWGHEAMTFRWKAGSGASTISRKRPVQGNPWASLPDKIVTIPPKESVLWKVNFNDYFWGHLEWQGAPEPNSGEKVELQAVFELKSGKEPGVWSGRVESLPVSALIVNPRLKTPHKYIWNDCPKQALKMMKEDPTWINRKDPEDQCTPLHHAARFGPKEVVVWLIENKADVNAVAYNGFTPLHLTETREIAQLLIKAGAKLDQNDNWGKTPLQAAADVRRTEVVDAILDSGFLIDLATAIQLGKRERVFKMLAEDPNVVVGGAQDSSLWGNSTPLGQAVIQGDFVLVRLLLEAGAPINDPTRMPNAGGDATPLTNAVWKGNADMVELLLKKGASVQATGGKFYSTITEFAAKKSDARIQKLLKDFAANPPPERLLPEKVLNKLPARIKAGEFKMPALDAENK